MSFGLNSAQIIGRLGADVAINSLASGGRVANMSVATDESFIDKTGQRVDRTEWHRVVSFQNGLIDMLEKHAKKGRLVYVAGKLQTRKWRKEGEDSDRYSTEIILVPGSRVQFLERPATANGSAKPASNGEATAPAARPPPPTRWTAACRSRGRFLPRSHRAGPALPRVSGPALLSCVNDRDAARRRARSRSRSSPGAPAG